MVENELCLSPDWNDNSILMYICIHVLFSEVSRTYALFSALYYKPLLCASNIECNTQITKQLLLIVFASVKIIMPSKLTYLNKL